MFPLGDKMKIKTILYPTDFSHKSENAREHAIYLAKSLGCEVHLLHAIEPLDYDEMDDEIMDFYKGLEKQAESKMDTEKQVFISSDVRIKDKVIIGQRWKVINNYSIENNIDLIILGSHGARNESGDLSIGTTSHKVMFSSPCPLLIVRHEGS